MKLHELEDFEHVLELEQPLLRLVTEEYLDLVAFATFLHGGVANLVEALLANDLQLRHKSRIVLQDVNCELLRLAVAIDAPLAHSEFETGLALPGFSVLHPRGPTEVRCL